MGLIRHEAYGLAVVDSFDNELLEAVSKNHDILRCSFATSLSHVSPIGETWDNEVAKERIKAIKGHENTQR